MPKQRVCLAAAAGLALLAPVVWACRQEPAPEPAGQADPELERLRDELTAAQTANAELAAQVETLKRQFEELAWTDPLPAPDDPQEPEDETPADSAEEPGELPAESGAAQSETGNWFRADALLAAGLPPHEVERLREMFDSSEMARIELRYQAQQEGWLRTHRYRKAEHRLELDLREEIGDERFDLLLYASGRKNRVLVSDVLHHSPGERAGLLPGDVILSYADERIFSGGDLKRATLAGDPGERVALDVLRDGETIRLYTERGPIGSRLSRGRVLPEAVW
jgi:hypothetical protein